MRSAARSNQSLNSNEELFPRAVKRGDLLMAHTDGTLKKATAGTQVLAMANRDAAKDTPCEVIIMRTLIAPSA